MKSEKRCAVLALLLLTSSQLYGQAPAASGASVTPSAKASADDTYKEQKDFAFMLFKQNHHLEALPVFEDLAKRNPGDTEVLFGLGACLIDHSATVQNEGAAKEERIRAREYLLRAKQLGNNNGLLLTLLEITPADGSVNYGTNPAVAEALKAGEAAFAKNNYPEAIQNYSAALKLDPNNYAAALFIGDSYFAQKKFPEAADWYDRAISINPDTETAYRYEADMLTKNGEQGKARKRLIEAIVAEPYSQITWRALAQWANFNHLQLKQVRINTHTTLSSSSDGGASITVEPITPETPLTIWIVYNGVRLNWRKEEFKKHYPKESAYRHTLAEETDALTQAAAALANEKPAVVAADPDLALLKALSDAGMLEPYILLSVPDREIALDYIPFRENNRQRLQDYLGRFVAPEAPAMVVMPATVPVPAAAKP